jgi:hypothetical protein
MLLQSSTRRPVQSLPTRSTHSPFKTRYCFSATQELVLTCDRALLDIICILLPRFPDKQPWNAVSTCSHFTTTLRFTHCMSVHFFVIRLSYGVVLHHIRTYQNRDNFVSFNHRGLKGNGSVSWEKFELAILDEQGRTARLREACRGLEVQLARSSPSRGQHNGRSLFRQTHLPAHRIVQ